jgi:hypothetical protein
MKSPLFMCKQYNILKRDVKVFFENKSEVLKESRNQPDITIC